MMNGIKNLFKRNQGGFWSGLFVGTSYIPFPPWALLFAYVPLWVQVLRETSLKRVFFLGWVTQFVLTLIGFHWVAYTALEFGHFPWPVAILTLLAFAALAHLYIPIALVAAMAIKNWTRLSDLPGLLVIALCLILGERLWPSIFPWHLGYTFLWLRLPIYQWADVIGFEGLSSLVLLLNGVLAWTWLKFRAQPRKLILINAVVYGVLGILSWAGSWHSEKWKSFDTSIQILGVQGNIGNFEKMYAEQGLAFQDVILDRFISLTDQGLRQHPELDLIIWPETAFPDYFDEYYQARGRQTRLSESVKAWKKPLIMGSFSKDPLEKNTNRNTFNAAFLIGQDGSRLGPPYRKSTLLAFGEYMPFSEMFPILLRLIPVVSNFGRGHGPALMTWPRSWNSGEELVRIGPQICYEGLAPDFSRSLSLQGANFLANFTNDSWFGRGFEPEQHRIMTLARAIELRRPLIRATNTGITTGMLADGTELKRSPMDQTWVDILELRYLKNAPQTFYARFGDIDFWIYLGSLLLIIFIRFKTNLSKSRNICGVNQ